MKKNFYLVLAAIPVVLLFSFSKPSAGGKKSIYHKGWIDFNKNGIKDIYEDTAARLEDRIEDLLSQMNMNEKTAQMVTLYGYGRVAKDQLPTPQWKNEVWIDGLANIDEHLNGVVESDYMFPYSKHVFALNEVQRFFVEETRLGIPVEFTTEGIRGLNHTKATSFPPQIGVGSTFHRELALEIGKITGSEAFALGYDNVYSPIMDVARDQRWGRIVETYGEDPYLVAEMGLQQIRGLQRSGVVSTLKHFAVYSVPKGGRDGYARTDPHVTDREVYDILLYPFKRGITEGGALGIMSSYNDYNGVPITGSKYFLTTLLRDKYHFRGYVVSDSWAVKYLHTKHKVAATYKEAVRRAVEAGLNVRTTFDTPASFLTPLRELVAEGVIPEETINSRVRDVLRVKFIEGLFDHPYRDENYADKFVNNDKHKAVALQAARESIVLLKNDARLLPIDPERYQTLLVCGPNAKAEKSSVSRYGPNHIDVVSGYEGIVMRVGKKINIDYARGCYVFDKAVWPLSELYPVAPSAEEQALIDEAVEKAQKSDLIIVFAGEDEHTVGESRSRTSLDLPGNQRRLLKALKKTGKPIVLVLINGRPLSVNWAQDNIPAIVEAWFPGMYGGTAVAEVLFGDYNPGGKMPVTTPRTAGQIPFNFPCIKASQAGQPGKGPNGSGNTRIVDALYPFGFGLSYTAFGYDSIRIKTETTGKDTAIIVSCTITNTGDLDGDEVVQLYIRKEYGNITTYEKILRGFERITLKAGESKNVTFSVKPGDLALYDPQNGFVTERGEYNVLIGSSSVDIRLQGTFPLTTSQ